MRKAQKLPPNLRFVRNVALIFSFVLVFVGILCRIAGMFTFPKLIQDIELGGLLVFLVGGSIYVGGFFTQRPARGVSDGYALQKWGSADQQVERQKDAQQYWRKGLVIFLQYISVGILLTLLGQMLRWMVL